MIKVSNLEFNYEPDGGPVLCDINNLEIKQHELVSILGPNGAGKSTLIRHFNALLLPTFGEVYVDGLDTRIKRNHVKIREIVSLVFQNPLDQFIGLTVFEDFAVPLRMRGYDNDEVNGRVEGVLKEFNLSAVKDRYPHDLSGGEQKLLSIASSLILDPKVIVLDEPTVMLDRGRKRIIHDKLLELNKKFKKTVVIATCDPDEATLADKIYVLCEGKIVSSGVPSEVFRNEGLMEEIGVGTPNAHKSR